MENLICNAYTVLEFNFSFEKYLNDNRDMLDEEEHEENWNVCLEAYETVCQYMTDDAIKQAQALVMGEF